MMGLNLLAATIIYWNTLHLGRGTLLSALLDLVGPVLLFLRHKHVQTDLGLMVETMLLDVDLRGRTIAPHEGSISGRIDVFGGLT